MTQRTLILVRHAKAEHSSLTGDDFGRPLSPYGHEQALHMGAIIAQDFPTIDTAIVSPAMRTIETFDDLCASLEIEECHTDHSVYISGTENLLKVAQSSEGIRVMIIGHEPTISHLSYELCAPDGPRDLVSRGVPTATAVLLTFDGEWSELKDGICQMEVFFYEEIVP